MAELIVQLIAIGHLSGGVLAGCVAAFFPPKFSAFVLPLSWVAESIVQLIAIGQLSGGFLGGFFPPILNPKPNLIPCPQGVYLGI